MLTVPEHALDIIIVFKRDPHPPLLALSIQQQLMGVLHATETGLRMRSPAHGTVEIQTPREGASHPAELTVTDSGHVERYRRLPELAPTAAELAAQLTGTYYYADFDCEFTMVLDDGVLFLDLCPPYGRSRLQLEILSDEVCSCTLTGSFPIPVPTSGCLSIERDNGQVVGLWLNSARTRNLWLQRRR